MGYHSQHGGVEGRMAYSSGRDVLFTMLSLHHTDSVFYFTSLLARQKTVGIYGVSSILHSVLGWGEDIIAVA